MFHGKAVRRQKRLRFSAMTKLRERQVFLRVA
jgi:hypothetical protein